MRTTLVKTDSVNNKRRWPTVEKRLTFREKVGVDNELVKFVVAEGKDKPNERWGGVKRSAISLTEVVQGRSQA